MKNALLIAALVVLGGIAGYYFFGRPAAVPVPSPIPAPTPVEVPAPSPAPVPTPMPMPPAARTPKTFTISMTPDEFSPTNLTIRVGDTVVFRNDDTKSRWPASAIHPTHLLCPGFDSLEPIPPGGTYSYTFTVTKECPMHDHLIPSLRGKITVTE